MAYTTIDDPSVFFNTVLYTGNQQVRNITFGGNSDLALNWIWLKSRSSGYAGNHHVYDSVRGVQKHLRPNLASAEGTNGGTDGVTAFGSNGFTVGANTGSNENNITYVGWGWKAGTSFTNDASSTSVGSIDSAGSVNTDAGFSIITYTGTGSNATVAHGLGVAPTWILLRDRDSGDHDWFNFHKALGNGKYMRLNSDDAAATHSTIWNDTSPTSSVFSIGTNVNLNDNGNNFVAYCFAEKKGFSKFGSYIGNGNADGTFVYTGFKPAWIMYKNSESGSSNWEITDNKRAGYNSANARLLANTNGAEDTGPRIDILSNGFKHRSSGNPESNKSGEVYVFMAFAESPFVTSTGIPATAQ